MPDSARDIVVMQGIDKSFPGVHALQKVDFSLARGEIHALVGENGAGKSTLIKVLTGVERADEGTIELDGQPVLIHTPIHAQELGISTVYQEVNLCPNLTVAENILIGRQPTKFGLSVDWKKMNKLAAGYLQQLDVDIDVTRPLRHYSIAIQQMTAIARALVIRAKVLILDEPTSSLTGHEVAQLFSVMRKLKSEGIGVLFITHFLDQVYEITDRITVMRNGAVIGTYDTASLSRMELVRQMLGRTIADLDSMNADRAETGRHISSEVLLEAHEIGLTDSVEPFDLSLHAGEVVGLAGLLGSGRTEVANLLFGVNRPDQGQMSIGGKNVSDFSPQASVKRGVGLCPEDRKVEGIISELTIRENIVLALQARLGWFRRIGRKQQQEIADRYIKLLNIATPSSEQLIKNLSGGNQQKVILARWLATDPRLLILDEPTRGIDVGTKADIQKLVISLAQQGKSCVFISSELDEVLRTSHRVIVMRDREKVKEFTGQVDAKELMQSIAGSVQ